MARERNAVPRARRGRGWAAAGVLGTGPILRARTAPSLPSAYGVEHQRQRVIERRLAVTVVVAESPIAQRPQDRAQDEVRERVARDVTADLAAGLRELDQRLDQLVRALHAEALPAGP